ncbi:MAG: hypothetical protein ACLPXB_08635 [Thiobacillaceae bacterium]
MSFAIAKCPQPYTCCVVALLSACSIVKPAEQGFYTLGLENGKAKYRMMGGYYGLEGDSYDSKYLALDKRLAEELKAHGYCQNGSDIVLHTTSQGGGYLLADALCR